MTHLRCRIYAWAWSHLLDTLPAPREGMHGPEHCHAHPECQPTRWAFFVDWFAMHVCEPCDAEIFGT